MSRFGRWCVETRLGRFLSRGATVVLIIGVAYAVIWEVVQRQTGPITKRVEVIERAKPTEMARACLRIPRCRQLLASPPSDEHSGAQVAPAGGDASQPAHAGQPPKPGKPGAGPKQHGKAPAAATAPSEAPPAAPSTPSAPPPALPGNSGGGDSAEHGSKTCVDLVVSACVEAGASSDLLP